MKKASKILFLIGGIYSIVSAATFLLLAVMFIVIGILANPDVISEGLLNGTITSDVTNDPVELSNIVRLVMFINSGMFLLFMGLNTANAIVSFKAKNEDNKTLFVSNIVLGIISQTIINLVGGIFALIAFESNE